MTNLQGDVIAVCDNTNVPRFFYHYDAWGKLLSVTNTNGEDVTGVSNAASWNILRYRGYIYDQETGFYYVSSRYYDPEICRWINADCVISCPGRSVHGFNLFEYCDNNPVNKSDCTGAWPKWIKNVADMVTKASNKAADVGIGAVAGAVNSNKSSFSLANRVKKTHITTPELMLDLGVLIGKIGVSSTVTKQDKEPGLVHISSDVGNDASKYSAGINIAGWLGADVGVSSEINAFVCAQVTPWIHGEVSLGFDGIGASFGIDLGDKSFDFEINGGIGLISIFVVPQVGLFDGQLRGAMAN